MTIDSCAVGSCVNVRVCCMLTVLALVQQVCALAWLCADSVYGLCRAHDSALVSMISGTALFSVAVRTGCTFRRFHYTRDHAVEH